MASGASVDKLMTFKQESNKHNKNQMKFQVPKIYTDTPLSRHNHQKNIGNYQRTNRKNSKDGGGHKRRYTYSGGFNSQDFKNGFKRRRCSGNIVPPTKFLLGGNINDPLNLGSLADEEVNRKMNEVTPYSSPVPPPPRHHGQIEVLIPQNINDPLNLNSGEEIEFKVISPKVKKRKKNKKKRSSGDKGDLTVTNPTEGEATDNVVKILDSLEGITPITEPKDKKDTNTTLDKPTQQKQSHLHIRTFHDRSIDKIVSPVVPQGSPMKFRRHRSWSFSNNDEKSKNQMNNSGGSSGSKPFHKKNKQNQPAAPPVFRKQDERFQHGNYNRYYGYRNGPQQFEDPRLKIMKDEWFVGLDVLDIGCNVGHLTLSIARDYKPKKMIGLDIDDKLIKAARKNVRHYLTTNIRGKKKEEFPISLALCHGPIVTAVKPIKSETSVEFPNNVFFVQGNYVPESEEFLEMQRREFDTILCLSLTKWIHLNNGDDGLKRTFKRVFAQLQPGGKFILEAQPWKSYAKKKKLTETIYNNYQKIKLKPEQFNEYLLSSEIGFSTCELIDAPKHSSKGFCRPIYVFTKSDSVSAKEMTSNEVDVVANKSEGVNVESEDV